MNYVRGESPAENRRKAQSRLSGVLTYSVQATQVIYKGKEVITINFKERISYIERAHRILNNYFFEGKLSTPFFNICNIDKYVEHGILGMFVGDTSKMIETMFTDKSCAILFSHEQLERSENEETENAENAHFISTLLHEMIHQYCHENNIKDSENGIHLKSFADEAEKHGLIVWTIDGTNYDFTFLNPDYEEVWEMLNAYYEDIV